MGDIARAVKFMIDTANDNSHGYDQVYRNGPDYDCSSLVATALFEGGFDVNPSSWTGNIEAQLRRCGFVECEAPWRAGDIHLKRRKHIAMSVSKTDIVHASINELGKISGGKTGDQTGAEICRRKYYKYAGGWDVHLRYKGTGDDAGKKKTAHTVAREVIAGRYGNGEERKKKLEAEGYDYNIIQATVNLILNGDILKDNLEIAREVIKGVWGTGDERRIKLTQAGYSYSVIQGLVNSMMKG